MKNGNMQTFEVSGFTFQAENLVEGVLINPELPDGFDCTPNEDRGPDQEKWWHRPFIRTETVEEREAYMLDPTYEYVEKSRAHWLSQGRDTFLKHYPGGVSYDVRCLDGGAWDRSTNWGVFATLEDALACAKNGPDWRKS